MIREPPRTPPAPARELRMVQTNPVNIAGVDIGVLLATLPMARGMKGMTVPAIGDIETRRRNGAVFEELADARFVRATDVVSEDRLINVPDRDPIRVRIYRKRGSTSRASILYIHGGGLIGGSLDGYDSRCMHYASGTGITVISVDYRLAPEHPYPAALDDATFALRWLHAHAADLGLDAKRIGIAGDSAGGCLAAATVLRNQDERGPAIKCQLLVYPMLDYRTVVPDPRYTGRFIGWTFADNLTAWTAYLGKDDPDVPPATASPALATQLAGLPPTFIDTGTMDIFHDEDAAFADLLRAAGVDVEFHVWNGAPHGFDYVAGRSGLAKRAWKARFDFLQRHLQG